MRGPALLSASGPRCRAVVQILPSLAQTLHMAAAMATALDGGLHWPPRQALVSLHDVTPAHGDTVFLAIDHLRSRGVSALTLLVVPDYHHRAALADHPQFCARLRAALGPRDEVVLHGYHHLADRQAPTAAEQFAAAMLTAGEGEFLAFGFDEAKSRIDRGIAAIQAALNVLPRGFVAPAWLQNGEVVRAARAAGMAWCEDHSFVYNLMTGEQILAPAVSLASRDIVRRLGSRAVARAGSAVLPQLRTVRLAVHPGDYGHPKLVATLDRVLAKWLPAHPAVTVREIWDSAA